MNELKKQILFYNNQIVQKENKVFEIEKGKIPIILSAPHCVPQTRNGKIKQEEGETGAIVQIIAKKTQCYTIFKTSHQNDDANYDIDKNMYKENLREIINRENIKLLLDLHGAKNENAFDIEIGTDEGKNINQKNYIVAQLKEKLNKQKIFNIVENQKFKASSIHTICKYIHETTNIPCIQLEITGRYRYIENLEGIKKLIMGIEDFIETIKESL